MRPLLLGCLICLLSTTAAGQTPAPTNDSPVLTPEQIADAIQWGTTGKPKPYYIDNGAGNKIAAAYTPFLRIALAAREAADKYQAFKAADIPADVLKPQILLRVWVYPTLGTKGRIQPKSIVALPRGAKDPSQAIQPTWVQEDTDVSQNVFGAQFENKGIWALFPMSLATPDYEFVAVYDRDTWTMIGRPEERIRGACPRTTRRGCVTLDRKDPIRIALEGK